MREVVRTNWASDKGTLIRQLDALDSIAQDGVSDREIPKLINPLGAISRNFENQPLYLQEATLAHLRGIREEINGKSFTIRGRMHYGEELGYIQRQIAQMEQVTALTRQSFHESLAQFGYKDLSILERHRFTPASLMEMYEASKRKGEPQQPLVRWLVEDLDFKKLAKETPDVQVTEDLVKSRFVLGYRPGRGGFLRPSISWGRRRY